VVLADVVRSSSRDGKGYAPIADAVFENRPAMPLGERRVVTNVLGTVGVSSRVVDRVFEVRTRADFELAIDPSACSAGPGYAAGGHDGAGDVVSGATAPGGRLSRRIRADSSRR
jgi:hypothetical protein